MHDWRITDRNLTDRKWRTKTYRKNALGSEMSYAYLYRTLSNKLGSN